MGAFIYLFCQYVTLYLTSLTLGICYTVDKCSSVNDCNLYSGDNPAEAVHTTLDSNEWEIVMWGEAMTFCCLATK